MPSRVEGPCSLPCRSLPRRCGAWSSTVMHSSPCWDPSRQLLCRFCPQSSPWAAGDHREPEVEAADDGSLQSARRDARGSAPCVHSCILHIQPCGWPVLLCVRQAQRGVALSADRIKIYKQDLLKTCITDELCFAEAVLNLCPCRS